MADFAWADRCLSAKLKPQKPWPGEKVSKFFDEVYIDIIRMIGLLFAPLLVGAVVLAIVLIFFAIIGSPG